jgi:hypothetical protein
LKNYLLPLYVTKSIWIIQEAGYFDFRRDQAVGYKEFFHEVYKNRWHMYFLKENTWRKSIIYYSSFEEACDYLQKMSVDGMRLTGPPMLYFYASMYEPTERGFVFGVDEIKTINL